MRTISQQMVMNKSFPTYSVAIRTLGKAGQLYQKLLNSIASQTVRPEKIVVYIAESYPLPKETIGIEEYVYVTKGMVAQRALSFQEINSEYILMLDDDAFLQPNSVEKLLCGLIDNESAKCIAANAYGNHLWSPMEKFKYAILGTTPRKSDEYAFRVKSTIAYSYNILPKQEILQTESFAGLAFLIHADTLRRISFKDEVWMDEFGYAMGDDLALSYKLYMNGCSLLLHYNSGILHQDAKTGHSDVNFAKKLKQSTSVLYVLWHRIRISHSSFLLRIYNTSCFILMAIWKTLIYALISVYRFDIHIVIAYIKGIDVGMKYTRTNRYKALPPFIMSKRKR